MNIKMAMASIVIVHIPDPIFVVYKFSQRSNPRNNNGRLPKFEMLVQYA